MCADEIKAFLTKLREEYGEDLYFSLSVEVSLFRDYAEYQYKLFDGKGWFYGATLEEVVALSRNNRRTA